EVVERSEEVAPEEEVGEGQAGREEPAGRPGEQRIQDEREEAHGAEEPVFEQQLAPGRVVDEIGGLAADGEQRAGAHAEEEAVGIDEDELIEDVKYRDESREAARVLGTELTRPASDDVQLKKASQRQQDGPDRQQNEGEAERAGTMEKKRPGD